MSDYAPLLKRLNHWNRKVRDAALTEAKALPPDALLELARLEAQQYRRRERIVIPVRYTLATVWGLGVLLYGILRVTGHKIDGQMLFMLQSLAGCTAYFLPLHGRRSIAKILALTNDIRFLGPALEMLARNTTDNEVVISLSSLWMDLLPQVRADHTHLLTAEQRGALVTLIGRAGDNMELLLAVLKALEQVGDERAIPAVKRLIQGEFDVVRPSHRASIKKAAADCLPYLQQNAERFQQANTLLRPSSSENAAAPAELLRPAAYSESTPSEQLLRASGGPQAE
jgi:hypothetical protein